MIMIIFLVFFPLVFHIYVFLPKGSTIRYQLVWLGIMIVFFDMPTCLSANH